jgi:hypothetical protein
MLSLILQAAQQAPQVVPDVHIVLQQPPPSGMPEWAKTLISAGVGALFAIAGNVVMEFIKIRIERRRVARQLSVELVDVLSSVIAASQLVADSRSADPERKSNVANVIITFLKNNRLKRYAYFTNNQQSLIYGISEFEKLSSFDTFQGGFSQPSKDDPLGHLNLDLEIMTTQAKEFLTKHYPKYSTNPKNYRELYDLELSVVHNDPFGK